MLYKFDFWLLETVIHMTIPPIHNQELNRDGGLILSCIVMIRISFLPPNDFQIRDTNGSC